MDKPSAVIFLVTSVTIAILCVRVYETERKNDEINSEINKIKQTISTTDNANSDRFQKTEVKLQKALERTNEKLGSLHDDFTRLVSGSCL